MNTTPTTPPRGDVVDQQNPWPGLATFSEAQQAFFFGRDEEARELVRRIERKTLTVLFGQSGLGKSSLLQAGVFPRLRTNQHVPIYIRLDHGTEAPPLVEQISRAVANETSIMGVWSRRSATPVETLWELFHHRDDVLTSASGRQLIPVLIFDQFEELFTLGATDDTGQAKAVAFTEDLADLVENRAPASVERRFEAGTLDGDAFDFSRNDYRVLITLREDYLPHFESLKTAMPSLMQNRMRLTRLSGNQALEAVTRPAPGLVPDDVARAIVAFVSGRSDTGQAEVEPSLLSLVCRELNHRRQKTGSAQIDAALLDGSRETILTEFYERTVEDQPAAVRHWLENDLLTDSGFRENITLERARKNLAAGGAPASAIDTLVSRRLLRIEERLDVRRIELTHDVLCPVVRASRDVRREREAAQMAERRREESEAELAASRARELQARRDSLRARLVAGFSVALALVAIAAAIWGYRSQKQAQAAEVRAIAARADALKAKTLADTAREQAEDLLAFLQKDLSDELSDLGQLPALRRMSERLVRYYDGLPPSMLTRDARADQAVALTRFSAVLESQREFVAAGKMSNRANHVFDQLAKDAPLTPAMVIERMQLRLGMANLTGPDNHGEAKKMCLEVVQTLAPILKDPILGPRATDLYLEGLFRGGQHTSWAGDFDAGTVLLQRAVKEGKERDARTPTRHPGLLVAEAETFLADNLSMKDDKEPPVIIAEAQKILSDYVDQHPGVQTARTALARVKSRAVLVALRVGDNDLAKKLTQESREATESFIRLDPQNAELADILEENYACTSWICYNDGDYAGVKENSKKVLEVVQNTPGEKRGSWMQMFSAGAAAEGCAQLGQSEEAQVWLKKGMQLARDKRPGETSRSFEAQSDVEIVREWAHLVDLSELRWPTMRERAETAIRELEITPVIYGDYDQKDFELLFRAIAAWGMTDRKTVSDSLHRRSKDPAVHYTKKPPQTVENRIEASLFLSWNAILYHFIGEDENAQRSLDLLRSVVEQLRAHPSQTVPIRGDCAFADWAMATSDRRLNPAARSRVLANVVTQMQILADENRLSRFHRDFILPRAKAELGEINHSELPLLPAAK